jgi:ribosomal protein L11 methyltransferase
LIRLALRCRRAEAEAVLAELLELVPAGVEEVSTPSGQPDVVEYAVYGAAGELPELGEVQAAAGGALVEVRTERVPDDWEDRWKRFYHPLLVAGRLYVRPPWERPAERAGVSEVVIDPGQAFGTGTHATTAMCLELLVQTASRSRLRAAAGGSQRSLCDLGCGSGVLAIAAVKLGFSPVLAVDSEQSAIAESDRNARANYVEIELRRLDLRREPVPVADLVTANLTTRLLERVAQSWVAGGTAPGEAIVSGFLANESEKVREALESAGLREQRRAERGEWGALLASRPRSARPRR